MINQYGDQIGIKELCVALGESRASWYRAQKPRIVYRMPRPSGRRLSSLEEKEVLETLNEERFGDMAPGEIYTVKGSSLLLNDFSKGTSLKQSFSK